MNTETDCQTVIGADAHFKGELTFEKCVRIQGMFEGKIRTKGTLHVAEGAKVTADIDSGELRVDGELKGNVNVSGKLTLSNSARMEGDLRTTRLEMADGAVFVGNVTVGQQHGDAARRDSSGASPSIARDSSPPVRTRPTHDPMTISVPALAAAGR